MDDGFYNAFLPASITICGRRLRGLTLWQAFMLAAVESPFAGFGDQIEPRDIVLATKICMARHGEPLSMRTSFRDRLWTWRMTRNRWLFRRECVKFSKFINDHNRGPFLWQQTEGACLSIKSAPTMLRLACCLMVKAGFNESDAWNASMGKALWMDGTMAQISGVPLSFLDDEDMDDSEIDISGLTDAEAMEKFTRDLPAELVAATFDHWKSNIKKSDA